jgi:hypothetical protein
MITHMQFKPITTIVVLSLVVASLLVAGCTNYSAPDYTAYLEKYMSRLVASMYENDTVSVTKPLSRTGDRTYVAEYKVTSSIGTITQKYQTEVLTSKGAAVARYEQLVRDKVNSGWTIHPSEDYNIPDFESAILDKSQNHDESYVFSYSNDTKINEWLVSSIYVKYDF